MASDLERWRQDPRAFVCEVLVNPETGRPFELYPAEERFFREALTLGAHGRLPYPELIYSCPKKSGKTGFAAMAVLYVVVVLGGPYAGGYCVANDFEQLRVECLRPSAGLSEGHPRFAQAPKSRQTGSSSPLVAHQLPR
jgi:hypothetical protein